MSEKTQKSQYRVISLKTEDLPVPWFSEETRNYRTQLPVFQKKLGAHYSQFSEWVGLLLNHIDEARQIRRILPKTEWVLGYWIKISIAQKEHNYLLIMGAEVSTKPKSMGYGAGKDHYECQNCYYVLGSLESLNTEKFGTPSGVRQVRNHKFHEYLSVQSAHQDLVLRLMKIIMAKENINPPKSKE